MKNTVPDWMKDAEVLGHWLAARASYAKNTSERLGQVSRVDAICWFLSKVELATARDVKRFATAFKGRMSTVERRNRRTGKRTTHQIYEPCYALLNTAYGGVGMDVLGKLRTCMSGSSYGPRAPLYRPVPKHYAATVDGLRRAERVQSYISR